jgi:type II secretory pathway pseudopilin PulG
MTLFSNARHSRHGLRRDEGGYVLLVLLLVIALMAIVALTVVTPIKFEMQRDQEQELVHRGVQYTRAIKAYYKKFGRYPTRLEDLDNTNNLRFLRKHYKDPVSKNQDFKLLHFGEPGVTLGGGLSFGGGSIPGANPVGSPGGLNGSGPGSSGFGGSGFGSSGFGNSGVNSSGVFSQSSGPGGSSNSGFGASSNSQTPSGQPGTNSAPGSDPTQASSQVQGTGQGNDSSSGQQLVTGGPIVGVASVNKNATIREFNKKKKYNEWQFVYDPANDRGGLITTPNQPALQGFGTQPGLNNTQPGTSTSSPFGQPTGFNNNTNPTTPPAQPPSNPPQPQ